MTDDIWRGAAKRPRALEAALYRVIGGELPKLTAEADRRAAGALRSLAVELPGLGRAALTLRLVQAMSPRRGGRQLMTYEIDAALGTSRGTRELHLHAVVDMRTMAIVSLRPAG